MSDAKETAPKRISVTSHDEPSTDEPVKPVITHRPMLKEPVTAPVVESSTLPDEPPPAKEGKSPSVNKSFVKPLSPPEETTVAAPKTADEPEDDAKTSAADKPATDTAVKSEGAPPVTPAKKDDDAKSSDEATGEDGETTAAVSTEEEVNAAAEAQAKHDEAIQKLVDSKQYFLPINAIEKRKTKRFVILGVVFSVLLLLAWADVALDAGIVHIPGVKPVTHFFSN